MNKTWIILSLTCLLFLPSAKGAFSYPQTEETMARVQRLLMASIAELPAEQWLADVDATGYQDFPAYKRFLEEDIPNDDFTYHMLIPFICKIDGSNMRSTGDADILRMVRNYLTIKSEKPDWQSAAYCLLYLSQKGTASDLPLLEKYSTLPSKLDFTKQAAMESLGVLQARASGTNMMTFLRTRYYCWSTNEPPFLPSVVNTGPQAVYVYDLLKQALTKYGDVTNIPPELVTMVVSFGADGKPVCNVDLAKYGLSMEAFAYLASPVPSKDVSTTAPDVPASDITNTPAASSSGQQPAVTFRLRLGAAIGIVGLFLAGVLILILKRRKIP